MEVAQEAEKTVAHELAERLESSACELRPDIDHLITEDDTPVDNIYSERQQRLLTQSLYASWSGPGEGRPFVAFANVGLFNSVREQAQVPDVMLSLDVTLPDDIWEKRHRSYFIWEYGKPPEVVIEVVSNKKGGEASTKLRKYASMGVAYYVIYDPEQQLSNEVLRIFKRNGIAYVQQQALWLEDVGLGLTMWQGRYEDWQDTWLRWCDRSGNILLTGGERAEQERQRAEQERQRAEQERQRAEQERQRAEQERLAREEAEQKVQRLAAQLRALGVEPEDISSTSETGGEHR
jgi:Uma2 family endonuclease